MMKMIKNKIKTLKLILKNSKYPAVQTGYIYLRNTKQEFEGMIVRLIFIICRIFPLQDKVIASSFNGKKYGDNTRYIVETLHEMNPNIDFVWVKNSEFNYAVPPFVRTISIKNCFVKAYEYATAKVWVDTHRLGRFTKKREDQLFIETWHGGLGIKKLDGDVPKFQKDSHLMQEVRVTSELADIFISNCNHLTNIYRSAFLYKGKIWKCGYPKNDVTLSNPESAKGKVKTMYGIPENANIVVYAPTFRDTFITMNRIDPAVYDIDYTRVIESLEARFGGTWVFFVKYHPFMSEDYKNVQFNDGKIVNVTAYPDIQEMVLAADAFISDYSSCIFDAAIRHIPCFTFATDFEEYKGDRGAYYEMEELPFPYATNNGELIENIKSFNDEKYQVMLASFMEKTGLFESGHASMDIAEVINEFIQGNKAPLLDIKGE